MIQKQTEQPYLTQAETQQLKNFAKTLKSKEGKSLQDAFRFNSESVVPQKYVGVICLRTVTIEILPKTESSETAEADRMSLVSMLEVCYKTTLHGINTAQVASGSQTILDIFISAFCKEAFTQVRKGFIRRYVAVEENLPVLRGRLDVQRHVRLNIIDRTRFYCRYDELQTDNQYNRILKFTLQVLTQLTQHSETLKQLQNLLGLFDEVQDGRYNASDIDRLTFDRLTERFKNLFNIAKLFLSNTYPDVKATPPRHSTMAFLVKMESLFEDYMRQLLKHIIKDFPEHHLTSEKGGQYLGKGKTIKGLETDFRIVKGNTNTVEMILDAKWKTKADDNNYYQMYSYAHCYDCPSTVLLLPRSNGQMPKNYTFNSPDNKERRLREEFIELHSGKDCSGNSVSMNKHVENQLRNLLGECLGVEQSNNDAPPAP